MNRKQHTTSWFGLLVIFIGSSALTWLLVYEMQPINAFYDDVLKNPESTEVKSVTFPDDSTVHIPNWELFKAGNLWSLASITQPLPSNYQAVNIIDTKAPHANDATKVSQTIEPALESLVSAAMSDGHELMLSSAYRSVQDQQTLYDSFVSAKGKTMADLYVAKPGTSEHHTGLAIDFGDASDICKQDSDKCSLGVASSEWLADNAYRFGFVLRYPEGKRPITGVAYEPWHYRYVGKTLASAIYSSDLTLDEALEQMYLAYAK